MNGNPLKPTIEGEIVDSSTALIRVEAMVRPTVSASIARENFKEYVELCHAILDENDSRNGYKLKSAWRKLATCFNLSVKVVSEKETKNDDGSIDFDVIYESQAPNGRSVIGDGSCNSREKNGDRSRHDTRATAHTRAFNRAVSNLIGAGEVSDEEIDDGHSESPAKPTSSNKVSVAIPPKAQTYNPNYKIDLGSFPDGKEHWLNTLTFAEADKKYNPHVASSIHKVHEKFLTKSFRNTKIYDFLAQYEAYCLWKKSAPPAE